MAKFRVIPAHEAPKPPDRKSKRARKKGTKQ